MKNISLAIIEVMKEVEWVTKSMTVWTGNNSYQWVSDKDVKTLLRNVMTKHWLSILPIVIQSKIHIDRWEEVDQYSKSVPKDMKTKQSVFTEVESKYLLLHTSGESIELAWYWQWVDTQDKGAGKATTYALKNTLLNMFLIPTGVDTDNTHSDEYDVPKKTTRVESKIKTDSDWATMQDYIESMKKAKNWDELRNLFLKWQSLCANDSEADAFTKVKDDKKVELWL